MPQLSCPRALKPSYKTPPQRTLPSKGWEVKSQVRLSSSHPP